MTDSTTIPTTDGMSLSPEQERIETLKRLMPEVFDEGKIDFEKLKATLGEIINFSNERYVLNWAGKSDAFRIMQRPSSATLVPCKEESVDFDTTQNIFIEGENMEVLKVLQKSYFLNARIYRSKCSRLPKFTNMLLISVMISLIRKAES